MKRLSPFRAVALALTLMLTLFASPATTESQCEGVCAAGEYIVDNLTADCMADVLVFHVSPTGWILIEDIPGGESACFDLPAGAEVLGISIDGHSYDVGTVVSPLGGCPDVLVSVGPVCAQFL